MKTFKVKRCKHSTALPATTSQSMLITIERLSISRIIMTISVNLLYQLNAHTVHVYYIYRSDMLRCSEHHLQGAGNTKFKTKCQKTSHFKTEAIMSHKWLVF